MSRCNRRKSKFTSKNLNQDDVIAFLDKYVSDFEDNLRDNNFDKMNTQLIENIIVKFDKIFHLWDENRILQNSIGKKYFEDIYKSMLNSFCTDGDRQGESINDYSDDFILECKYCGETFPLRNNDCRYSYDCHSMSNEHKEFVKNLEMEQGTDNSSEAESDSDADIVVDAYEQLFIYMRCNLCFAQLTFGDLDYKRNEAVAAKCMITHLESRFHRNKVELFRNNKQYIEEEDLNSNKFKCKLCQEDFYLDKLVGQHFVSEEHKKKVMLERPCGDGTVSKTDSDEKDSLDQDAPVLQRNLCNETKMNTKFQIYDKQLASKMAQLCIDKKQVFSRVIPPEFDFNADSIIFKDGVVQCKLCRIRLNSAATFFNHTLGNSHLKMTKLHESFRHLAVKEDDMIECAYCADYRCKHYTTFLKHCRSNNHVKDTTTPLLDKQKITKVIQCPVPGCSDSDANMKVMFNHLKTKHKVN